MRDASLRHYRVSKSWPHWISDHCRYTASATGRTPQRYQAARLDLGRLFLSWLWLFAHNLKRPGMSFLALLLVVLSLVDRSATVQNFVWRLDQHFAAAAQPSLLNAYISNLPVTVILMALCIPVGLRGNDWVSEHGKLDDYGRFVASQGRWATWGLPRSW